MAAILTLFSDFCASFGGRARSAPLLQLPLQQVQGPASLVFRDVAAVEASHDVHDVVEMGLV
jgi:hypothetical protein